MATRIEHDWLGEKEIPEEALYGVQTVRAIENFPISGLKAHPTYVWACAAIKRAAAEVHKDLGELDAQKADAIIQASTEVMDGQWREHFMVDVYQAGAGTSHNMNTNEVIANRANEILGGKRGDYKPVHPNDHVNMAQSTNDMIPTAIRIAGLKLLQDLYPALEGLAAAFEQKAKEFDHVVKPGRTHLQDAVPIRFGQEVGGYAKAIREGIARIRQAEQELVKLGLGGTAAGTGLNAHPEYRVRVAQKPAQICDLPLQPADDYFYAMQSMGPAAAVSGGIATLCLDLIRIANDLRLMNSGPRTGLWEVDLPPVQPGSSIMPGKANPVLAECFNMVCFQVLGCDTTIKYATQAGQLELNVMMPVIAHNLFHSITILTNMCQTFTLRCVQNMKPNEDKCKFWVDQTIGLATALNPHIGYHNAAIVARKAVETGKTVREIVIEENLLPADQVDAVLDPTPMTEPGKR